jgi:hypothetical protein
MTSTCKHYLGYTFLFAGIGMMWTVVGLTYFTGRLDGSDAIGWAVFLGLCSLAAIVAVLRGKSPADMRAWDTFLLGYAPCDRDRLPEDLKRSRFVSSCGKMSKLYRNRRPGSEPSYAGELTLDEHNCDDSMRSMGLSTGYVFLATKRKQQSTAHALGALNKGLTALLLESASDSDQVLDREGIRIATLAGALDAEAEGALLNDLRSLDPKTCFIECVGEWVVAYSIGIPTVANAKRLCALMQNHAL